MDNLDWIQAAIFLIIIAVQTGVFYNRVDNIKEDLTDLKIDCNAYKMNTTREIEVLKNNHQNIQLTIVNAPTKDDIKTLSSEVQGLKLTLVRLEIILEHLAKSQGVNLKDKRHTDT